MRLCPNGHEIPEYADGYCARCSAEARNRGKYTGQRRFDPKRFLDKRDESDQTYPPESTPLPPNKRMPKFVRQHNRNARPKATSAAKRPTFSPQRVLEGIEELIALVSEKEVTMQMLLAHAEVQPQAKVVFRDGRHRFVSDVREHWFALFKTILLREEARVIVRKVGLDGLTRPTSLNDLAERCQLSVEQTRRYEGTGLRKLRESTNRHAVMACVTDSARLLLR